MKYEEPKTFNVEQFLLDKCGVAEYEKSYPFGSLRSGSAKENFKYYAGNAFGDLATEKMTKSSFMIGHETRHKARVVMMSYDDYMTLLDKVRGLELIGD